MLCFSNNFKSAVALNFGGGGAIMASDVVIDSISADTARRRVQFTSTGQRRQMSDHAVIVDFHIDAPASVQVEAASLMKTLKESGRTIDVAVGGVTYSAPTSTMAEPVVTRVPDVDCEGAHTRCAADCGDRVWMVTVSGSGTGRLCDGVAEPLHGSTTGCAAGSGDCPPPAPEPEPVPVVISTPPGTAVPTPAGAASNVASMAAVGALSLLAVLMQ
eukprot:SAG22_NODE_1593_length_4040_cov_2.951028_3_plen_216_part_00